MMNNKQYNKMYVYTVLGWKTHDQKNPNFWCWGTHFQKR